MADKYITVAEAKQLYCDGCDSVTICNRKNGYDCQDLKAFDEIASADVAEIVRCRDCKHYVPNSKIDSICSGFCKKANWSKSWNDFCSDGERRTEDGES